MGVNISQIFRGSIILEKSPSSDILCVCLMLGDESNGGSIFLRSLSSFDIGYLFSFKYWIVLLLGFLFSLFGVMFSASSSRRSLKNTGTTFRWDGLINNIPAPVDSYWYLVKLNDIETLRGNFTLMR